MLCTCYSRAALPCLALPIWQSQPSPLIANLGQYFFLWVMSYFCAISDPLFSAMWCFSCLSFYKFTHYIFPQFALPRSYIFSCVAVFYVCIVYYILEVTFSCKFFYDGIRFYIVMFIIRTKPFLIQPVVLKIKPFCFCSSDILILSLY